MKARAHSSEILWLLLALLLSGCQEEPANAPARRQTTAEPSKSAAVKSTAATAPVTHQDGDEHLLAHKTGAVNQPLPGPLPRDVFYRGLRFTVIKGTLSDVGPAGPGRRGPDAARAYAYVDVAARNELNSTTFLGAPSSLLKLKLADDQFASPLSDWSLKVKPKAMVRGTLVFSVPPGTSWRGADLVVSEADKEPAVLPLEGPVPDPAYPATLALPATAAVTVGETEYRNLTASLDVEDVGKRIPAGMRYLKVRTRVVQTNHLLSTGLFGNHRFQLLADGATFAPVHKRAENSTLKSAVELEVVFIVPATLARAELEITPGPGEDGKPSKIPFDLRSAKAPDRTGAP